MKEQSPIPEAHPTVGSTLDDRTNIRKNWIKDRLKSLGFWTYFVGSGLTFGGIFETINKGAGIPLVFIGAGILLQAGAHIIDDRKNSKKIEA